MIEEIICKFWNKKHNIGVAENGKYFAKLPNGRIVDCGELPQV